jgi:hypothetical protein
MLSVRPVISASHDLHAFITDLPGLANSEVIEKFPRRGQIGQSFPIFPTHFLGEVGIHTLSVTADGGCQLVMVMVPYFTKKKVVFYSSEPPFHRRESQNITQFIIIV